jgi:hypothetical protein
VLGREYHAEASRGHVLQVQVVTAAVAELERFLGEIRPLDLRGDVASGAFQQDGLAEVSMPIEGRFASWCVGARTAT